MKLYYTDRAKNDIELAFEWYEKQRKGLGNEFLDSIDIALDNILDYPDMYQVVYFNFRRCVIGRFPFSIFYMVEKDSIIIHAVFDNRQDPIRQA